MTIATGTKLGPYEITGAIGAGGMGEVYRAHDPKLGRDVAIKVLPEAFARDAERMARFQREAKVLASLSHPNIATIYGLEDSGSTRALVMELVEGPTLADRIKAGPIPVDEAVRIARQIADALEYAHERGIIHRDLKPANVKVSNDDAVKVLDFGLAKALEGDPSSIDISTSPTISRMATQAGVLLGTAAYMSPEQAKAKSVDRRADIWSFGCVLYEMLTGKQAFTGETVTESLAAVIMKDPDFTLLPATTPMRVRVLLQRCLQKDPKQRLQAIGDARISLDEVLSGAPEAASSAGVLPAKGFSVGRWTLGISLGAALLVGAAIAAFVVWNLKPSPAKPVTRTVITLPPGQHLGMTDVPALALSADGTQLAYVAETSGGVQQIYLRAMDSLEGKPIAGTEGAEWPFFSPDGQWVGFFAGGRLKKISVTGGAAQTLADVVFPEGGSWGSQGTLVFGPGLSVLQQISEGGGAPEAVTRFEKGEYLHAFPELLPGSKAVLFFAESPPTIDVQAIGKGERRTLVQGVGMPYYAPSGHLIYSQGGNLMAVPFDLDRLEMKGTARPVVQGVLGGFQYSISATGSLVYVPGSPGSFQSRLLWVTRDGKEQPLTAPARAYDQPRLSPDGRRVAVGIEEAEGVQVEVYDIARDVFSRFTFEGRLNEFPEWTPDGKRIAFSSDREGPLRIFWQLADGSGGLERLTGGNTSAPFSWSPDVRRLAFVEVSPTAPAQIMILGLDDHKAQPFLQMQTFQDAPQFSPDGHWLAYASNESGRREIYVQPYPGPGGKWQVSNEGGSEPQWNRNGRELFYRSGDRMMAVEINTQAGFAAGKPRELFEGHYSRNALARANYDVSPDGQRFLMIKPVEQEQAAPTQINVVQNWTEELKRLMPTGNKQ